MLDTDKPHEEIETETESGFVEVETENGYTMSIFVLSDKDFNELKPTKETYRRVAEMLDNEPYKAAPSKPRSNRERIRQIVGA